MHEIDKFKEKYDDLENRERNLAFAVTWRLI